VEGLLSIRMSNFWILVVVSAFAMVGAWLMFELGKMIGLSDDSWAGRDGGNRDELHVDLGDEE